MAVQVKEITVAHSPDSDDAFMFYALAKNKLNTHGLKINQVFKDIQTLNLEALTGKYEVSAVSFGAYPHISHQYALMPCGASMGQKYGPVVVARQTLSPEELKAATIAIPGKLTTAYLALRLFARDLKVVEMPFDQIIPAVKSGQIDAGLLIHEGQLTYSGEGLTKVVDLGQWWFDETSLPLPLGGNVIRKDLGADLIKQTTKLLKDAIVYSLEHRHEALEYAMTFARDVNRDLTDKYIGMYVNELTVDCGDAGRAALIRLFEMSYESGIVDQKIQIEFA